jgi:hypothetical protein
LKQGADVRVCSKTIKKVIYKMVEIVERDIGRDMKKARLGALIYDGWSKDSLHYIGVIASFMRPFNERKENETVVQQRSELVLLSVAPMESISSRNRDDDNDDIDDGNTTKVLTPCFSAESQSNHFKKILRNYGLQFDSWCVCLIGDNASVNVKTAELCKKPHIGCKNHKLNLEVNAMFKEDNELQELLEKLQKLMVSLKTLKNSAVLDAYTHLRPTLYVKTRWTGKFNVCQKFLRLRDTLAQMHEDNDNSYSIPDADLLSVSFKNQVQRYCTMLGYMNCSCVSLQKKGIKLLDAQLHLDNLVEQVEEGNTSLSETHWARDCHLGSIYIGRDSKKLVSSAFHNGILKIQGKKSSDLTREEKLAVAPLKKDNQVNDNSFHGNDEDIDNNSDDGGRETCGHNLKSLQSTYEKHMNRKRKEREEEKYGQHINCDFILGSAAEIERVWSAAERVLTNDRFSTHPVLLEAILFLRFNQKYWTKCTVCQAIKLVQKEDSNKRYKKEFGLFGKLDFHSD